MTVEVAPCQQRSELLLAGVPEKCGSSVVANISKLEGGVYVGKDKPSTMPCFSRYRDAVRACKKAPFILTIYVKAKPVVGGAEDVRRWVELMNLCKFPCKYTKFESKLAAKDDNPYAKKQEEPYIATVAVDSNDYINATHLWVALTAIRYIDYQFASSYRHIPYLTSKYYNDFPELDAYQAFTLANLYAMTVPNERYCGDHGVSLSTEIPYLETSDKFIERVNKNKYPMNCNRTWATYTTHDYKVMSEMRSLFEQNKIEDIIKRLIK